MEEKITGSDPRQNILMAASDMFAQKGFKGTTIRDIALLAKVNTAAINYYYRDKEHLYLEVMRYWIKEAFKDNLFQLAKDESLEPRQRLRHFIYSMFMSLVGENQKGTGFGRLITVEAFFCPTDMHSQIVMESIREPARLLSEIISLFWGEKGAEDTINYYSACIVGQICYFYMYRYMINNLFCIGTTGESDLEEFVEHIYEFSVNAIEMECLKRQ